MVSSLQAILRQAADRGRRPFVIFGFLAGFALSAAIGVLLYYCLTAG
jgi:hypothetical protein